LGILIFVAMDTIGIRLCIFVYIWMTSSGPECQRHKPFFA